MPEFVFSANMQRKLTFKDKLITDAVAEYGYKQMFQVLRKKYGLVYSTGSSAFNDVENNTASISIRYIADETNLSKCHDIMIAEVFTPMSKAELSDSDVAVVKAMIENKYKLSFYDEDRLSNDYLKWALDYRKLFSIKDFQDEISKISAEEVRQFMKKLIILKEGL